MKRLTTHKSTPKTTMSTQGVLIISVVEAAFEEMKYKTSGTMFKRPIASNMTPTAIKTILNALVCIKRSVLTND